MCLDDHAHGLRVEHPIFQGPLPVAIEFEDVAVPENYRMWPGGETLGATLPMWRVQTGPYGDDVPGLVSDPVGFLDSPDAEIVSGGKNHKGSQSIAIGRQGHLVLWGFHADPTHLTPSGRNAFVNTVAWASEFDRSPRLVCKVAPSRDEIDVLLGFAGRLAALHATELEWSATMASERAALEEAQKERELTEVELERLSWPLPETPTFDEYAAGRLAAWFGDELFAALRSDVPRYAAWFADHRAQLLVQAGERFWRIDVDAQALGLDNRSVGALFDAADELESDDAARAAHALAFLRRATAQDFATSEEWLAWLEPREARLFHSDVGGYRFFERPHPPGPIEPDEPGATKVAFTANLVEDERGLALVVLVRISEGWHLYERVGPTSAYRPVSLALELPATLSAGTWLRPPARPYHGESGTFAIEGRATYRVPLTAEEAFDAAGLGAVAISYQVCDARRCLQPTTVRVPVVDRRER